MDRYAVYFAPRPDTDLAQFGAAWLGRDAFTGERILREDDDGPLDPNRLEEITESPRRYGFHATMKAPFELAEGYSVDDLLDELEAFGGRVAAFRAPPLDLISHHGFTTFVLSEPCAAMDDLHGRCVRDFDRFRAPLTPEDRARRRPDRLSDRQRGHLDRWGYPHVFEDFMFHLTLTNRLTDQEEIDLVFDLLEPVASVFAVEPLVVDTMCLFRQPDRDTPFTVLRQIPLSG